MRTIGSDGPGPSAQQPDREWCVHVATSVLQNVERELIAAWMACESFQRSNAYFYPCNRSLAIRMGVSQVRSAQRLLARLEALGILERKLLPGNHRVLSLRRRISEPITPGQWAAMQLGVEAPQGMTSKS